jgi:PAS domain S-box-containing protein
MSRNGPEFNPGALADDATEPPINVTKEVPCSYKTIEDIYFKVVEASPDAQIIIDAKGNIVVFNTQAEFMFGYERNEVLGHPLEVLLPEGQRGPMASIGRAIFRNRRREKWEPVSRFSGVIKTAIHSGFRSSSRP